MFHCKTDCAQYLSVVQAKSLCWSPDGLYLTVVGEQGSLQLWHSTGAGLALVHSFEEHHTHCVQWHSQVAKDGGMLLARYNHHVMHVAM